MFKKSLLLMLLMAFMAPWAANAQEPIPYSENFDSMSSESDLTAAGWISYGPSDCYIGITDDHYTSPGKALLISAWDGGNSSDSEVAALPVLNAPINTLQITLSYLQRQGGTVKVGYLTDADDASTFVSLQSLASSTSDFTTTTVDLSSAPSTAARIAIQQYTWYECYIDDILVETPPTCLKPETLTATLTPGNGTIATLNWTETGTASAWVLQYATNSTFTEGLVEITDGFNVDGTNVSRNLTGLTAETTYYARVKSDCTGGDYSSWSNTCTFKPTTIITIGSGTSTFANLPTTTNYKYSLTQQIYTTSELGSAGLIESIAFYNTATARTRNIDVYMVSTDKSTFSSGTDWITATSSDLVFSGSVTFTQNTWATITLDNSFIYDGTKNVAIIVDDNTNSDPGNMAFRVFNATSQAIYVYNDNTNYNPTINTYSGTKVDKKNQIQLIKSEMPDCVKPSKLNVSSITNHSAALSWTENGTSTAWDIYVTETQTDVPASSTTPTYADVSSNVNYPLTGLTASNTYYAYVRSKCTEDSDWSAACEFTTECDPIMVSYAGWIEDFNSYTAYSNTTVGTMPDCWSSIYKGTSSGYNVKVCNTTNYAPDGSSKYIFMVASSSASYGSPNYAIMPLIGNSYNNLIIEFDYKMGNNYGTLHFGYMTDKTDESTFTAIGDAVAHSKTKAHCIKDLRELNIPENAYLAFRFSETTTNSPYLGIDNVFIKDVTTFINPPTNLEIPTSGIGTNSATINWDANGETAWRVQFSSDDQSTWSDTVNVNTNSCTLMLEPNKTYYVRVCAVRGENTSSWCVSESFTTDCTAISVATEAYTYGFETDLPWNCWAKIQGVSIASGESGNSGPYQGDKYLKFSGNLKNYAALPQFTEETNTLQIKFWTRPESYSNSNCGTFDVGYLTDLADTTTFVKLERYKYNDWNAKEYHQKTVYFDNAPVDAFIAFRHNAGSTNWYWFVDDVEVSLAPACRPVKNLAATSVTNHSATITWNKGTEDQDTWQLKYNKDEDFNPDEAGTLVDNLDATTYTFNKTLEAVSVYYIYVRANCGGEAGNSPWTKVVINTLALKPVPTGLTVDNATLTPSSVSLDWTPGGGDYENSWDIYVATTSTTPSGDVTPTHAGVTEHPYTVSLTPNSYNYIWVRGIHGSDGASDWSLYKYVSAPEACPKPTSLTATEPTPNSIKLNWTAGAEWQTSWVIAYSTVSGFDPADASVETTHFIENVTEKSFVVPDLDPETPYYFRVKGDCGTTYGESAWNTTQATNTTLVACPTPEDLEATNITHTTADLSWTGYSDSYTVEYQTSAYQETIIFEDFEDGIPSTWTILTEGTAPNTNGWVTTTYGGSTVAVSYSYSSSTNYNANNWLISPKLNLQGTLKFKVRDNDDSSWNDEFEVLLSTTGTATADFTTTLRAMQSPSSSFTEITPIDLSSYAGQQGYIAIHHVSNGQYYIMIDDFGIYGDEVPAGGWEVATTTATNGTYTLEGLAQNTKYDVRVKGNCEGGEYSDVCTFTTYSLFTKSITAYTGDKNGWNLIASPVSTTVTPSEDNKFLFGGYDLYYFDQTQENEWVNYKGSINPGFNIVSGKGYLYANSEDVILKFVGMPYSGDGKIALTYDEDAPHFAGWNLVGNPFGTDATLDMPFFKMNDTGSGFTAKIDANSTVAAMEGVVVYAYDDDESQPISTATFTAVSRSNSESAAMVNIDVVSNGGTILDNAIVRFDEGRQLPKFMLFESNTKLYIAQDGKEYAIVSSNGQGTMPVNFRANENGQYILAVNAENVAMSYLHLIDNMTGADIDLLQTPSYTFNATTTDYESRFKLVFCTGVNDNSDSFAFCSNGNWIISNEGEATLQVIDVIGRILSSETVNGSVSKSINAAPGVYMIRLINGENVKVQKVVIE